jgi:hypothetical protein
MVAAYEDIRDIAERLIEREASKALTSNLTALAPEGLLVYFPETLQTAFDGRFMAVPAAARTEAADFAASYMLANLPTRSAAAKPGVALPDFFGTTWVDAWKTKCTTSDPASCAIAVQNLGGPARLRKQLNVGAHRPFADPAKPADFSGAKLIDECSTDKHEATDLACEVGLATRDAVLGNLAGVEQHGIRAAAFAFTSAAAGAALDDDAARTVRKKALDLAGAITWRLQPHRPDEKPPKGVSDDDQEFVDTVVSALGAARAHDSSKFDLKGALAAIEFALDFAKDVPCGKVKPPVAAPGTPAAPEPAGGWPIKNSAACTGIKASQAALLAIGKSPELTRLVEAAHGKDAKAITLRAIEVAVVGATEIVAVECQPPAAAPAADERSAQARPQDAKVAAAARKAAVTLSAARQPASDDVRAATGVSFEEMTTAVRDAAPKAGKTPAETEAARRQAACQTAGNVLRYAHLATVIADYAFEAEHGVPSSATRGALQDAAVEFLTTDGAGVGMERMGRRGWFTASGLLYPMVGLRASFSTGYVNSLNADGLRFVPTVTWPNFRWGHISAGQSTYAGLQLSLLDAADPLAEVALRSRKRFANEELVFVNFVRPRLDVMFGVPRLSRHLVLSAGASLRPVAAFTSPDKTSDFVYHTVFSCKGTECQGTGARFFEMSLGIQYLP